MSLFYEMVYNTFAFKYGIEINWNETHTYMFSLRCYKGINHIERIPKHHTFKVLVNCDSGLRWIKMIWKKKYLFLNHLVNGEHSFNRWTGY